MSLSLHVLLLLLSFILGSRPDSHQEVLRKDDHLSVGQCGRVHPASPRPVFSQMRLRTWQVGQAGRARTSRDHPVGWVASAAAAGQPSRVTGRTQCARVWKQTTGGSLAAAGRWGGERRTFWHLARGGPDQQVGHSHEQLQRGGSETQAGGQPQENLVTDSSTHQRLEVMERGQREQSRPTGPEGHSGGQTEAVGLGHREEEHSWGSASNPAQRMGEDLLGPRVGQGLMRASLMLIPGQSQANHQGNRLRPDTEMSPLYGCRRGKLEAIEG